MKHDEDWLGERVELAERIAEIVAEQARDRHHDQQRVEQPMGNPARQFDGSARLWRRRRAVPEAQGQPDRDQRKNGDAEVVVHTGERGIQRGGRLALLGRFHELGHAFTEDKLRENERGNQPVQPDLPDRVAVDGTGPVFL